MRSVPQQRATQGRGPADTAKQSLQKIRAVLWNRPAQWRRQSLRPKIQWHNAGELHSWEIRSFQPQANSKVPTSKCQVYFTFCNANSTRTPGIADFKPVTSARNTRIRAAVSSMSSRRRLERTPRQPLRISSNRRPGRHRLLLESIGQGEADTSVQPVRRHSGRADYQKPDFLLVRMKDCARRSPNGRNHEEPVVDTEASFLIRNHEGPERD